MNVTEVSNFKYDCVLKLAYCISLCYNFPQTYNSYTGWQIFAGILFALKLNEPWSTKY